MDVLTSAIRHQNRVLSFNSLLLPVPPYESIRKYSIFLRHPNRHLPNIKMPCLSGFQKIGILRIVKTAEVRNMLNVKWMSESLADESSIEVFDISGKNLITKRVDSRHGIDEQISIDHLPKSIIIVRVISGNKIYSEKVVLP